MRKGLLGSAFAILAGASLALAQPGARPPVLTSKTNSLPPVASPQPPPTTTEARLGAPQPGPSSGILDDRNVWGANAGRPLRFWASAEYLLWRLDGDSPPPLVTTGPALPLAPPPGSLAAPGTVVLFGDDDANRNLFSGGRFTLGFWCNDCQTIGAEASFFFLSPRSNGFSASTSGAPGSILLARPFFDTSTGTLNAELVGYPGLAAGNISVLSTSSLLGAESNLLANLCRSCDTGCPISCDPCDRRAGRYRVDLLVGLRYMELRDSLGIVEDTQVSLAAPAFAGANITAFDQFDTINRFYGGQVGIRSEWWRNRAFVNVTAKVAMGVTHQSVDIDGATRITTAGGATTFLPGNLLAQPSNIGRSSRDVFSVIPEVGVNAGYQLTRNVSVFAGYTFIYWSNVQRPGDAINTAVNSTRTPASTVAPTGPLDPLFNFNGGGFWAQGINAGIQLRF